MVLIDFITKAAALVGRFLVFSSVNPEQISRTLTALVPLAIPAIMLWTGLDQNAVGEAVSDIVTAISLFSSALFLIIKVVRTLSRNNVALK